MLHVARVNAGTCQHRRQDLSEAVASFILLMEARGMQLVCLAMAVITSADRQTQ